MKLTCGLSGIAPSAIAWVALCYCAFADEASPAPTYRRDIQPILAKYCFDCHGNGSSEGGRTLDQFKSDAALLDSRDLWGAVLKNVRAGLMPPKGEERPNKDEVERLALWIKTGPFRIDTANPDPGRLALRRLNRVEYRNTIRDLMGIDFNTDEEFPPDDTGYGFDNIADVLTVSPLLLEKYMQAAEAIVAAAVPMVSRVMPEKIVAGERFRRVDAPGERKPDEGRKGRRNRGEGDRLSIYEPAKLGHSLKTELAGDYRVVLEFEVRGEFDFDPGRCGVNLKIDDKEVWKHEFSWHNNKRFRFEIPQEWQPGERRFDLSLEPLVAVEKRKNSLDLRLIEVRVQGPLDENHWVRPKNFERFFIEGDPQTPEERRQYTRDVLRRFATKAFRRPVDDTTLGRLLQIAETASTEQGKTLHEGLARAMVAVLASPRFIFRVERNNGGGATASHSPVDEYTLASRLSYFLWSTMPDDELLSLAEKGELRKNLAAQVKRMSADSRFDALVSNFVGQWLQVRDVDGIDINARAVLFRDRDPADRPPPRKPGERRRFNRPTVELDRELRQAMRRETEMCFAHVVREDRNVVELIDADYTFVNERLARHYGLADVTGREMRRVTLPKDHPRGGILTHGAVLVVTSNQTRTSPVKRGLFVLDNVLGTPAPPPPPDAPQLEEAEQKLADREPTLRTILELHRNKPLCSACHARMDPIGLALENFNALGMHRQKERGQPIDSAGELITGESFEGIGELKRVLAKERKVDFYRCLTEKLLTYAIGRGLEHEDAHTVDVIVERLVESDGRFSALLTGIIESSPFQQRRNTAGPGVKKR